MPLETGANIRLVILNDSGRYETITPEELIERSESYIVDVVINNNLQDKYLLHHQTVASKTWTIAYDFGASRRANVMLFDDSFEEIRPQDITVGASQVDASFRQSITGYALLN